MSPVQPSREIADEAEMVKLQKSLRQQQRHSRPQVKKLTPAEIRSLNYESSVTKHSSNTKQQKPSRRANGQSPTVSDQGRTRSLPRSSTTPLPTPPRSPIRHDHRSSKHDPHDRAHPRVGRSATTNFPVPHGSSSRTSSVSSYQSGKSLQMYRGREVTQVGNHAMLRLPKQEIVTNPLSMFSRPRQSQLQASTSPDRFKRDFMEMDPYQAQAMLDDDSEYAQVDHPDNNRPEREVESPVSMDSSPRLGDEVVPPSSENDGPRSTVIKPPRPSFSRRESSDATIRPTQRSKMVEQITSKPPETEIASPAGQSPTVASTEQGYIKAVREQTTKFVPSPEVPEEVTDVHAPEEAEVGNVAELKKPDPEPAVDNDMAQPKSAIDEPQSKVSKKKRFSLHHMFDKKSQEKTPGEPTKQRRRTLSFTKTPETSPEPQSKPCDNSRNIVQTPGAEPRSPTHPAVRPLSRDGEAPPEAVKPKPVDLAPLTVPSVPTYGRCACCGKVRKPGYSSELSPITENDNLRTNFSFEAERAGTHKRHTAIIPMAIQSKDSAGNFKTVQAVIEPKSPESSAASMITPRSSTDTRNADASSVSSAAVPKSSTSSVRETFPRPSRRHTLDEPKIVRFGSLHGSRESDAAQSSALEPDSEEEIVQSVPFVQPVVQTRRSVLAPSEYELSRQRQLQARPVTTMSGAVPRPPHPLRQSSPIDQLVEELQNEHGADIQEAQQQEVKRVPKQDVITVVPIKRNSASSDAAPQTSSPLRTSSAVEEQEKQPEPSQAPSETSEPVESATSNRSSEERKAPKKLRKQQTTEYPPSSFPTSGKKSRRMSLPLGLGFRLPNSKRASTSPETFSVSYSDSQAGTPPETDPANKPSLPSQATSARTSFASALSQQENRTGRTEDRRRSSSKSSSFRDRHRSASRESTNANVDVNANANAVIQGVATGDAASAGYTTVTTSEGKTVRPSPSFAKFISNLPASHAKDVPAPKRLFGMGIRRRSMSSQRPPTIAENASNVPTPKIELNGNTLSKGNSAPQAMSNGHVAVPPMPLTNGNATPATAPAVQQQQLGSGTQKSQMPQSMSLPVLKLGEHGDGWASSGTLKGFMTNGHAGSASANGKIGGGSSQLATGQQQQGQPNNIITSPDVGITASPIEIRDTINGTAGGSGGFVGGRKLEMLLQRDRALTEVARV